MKDVLQDFILQVQDKDVALEDSRTQFEGFIASQSMVTYLAEEGLVSEDPK